MAIPVQVGATLHPDLASIKVQDGGTLRDIMAVWTQDGATLRKIWPSGGGGGYTPMSGSVSAVNGSYTASSGSHIIGNSNLTVSSGDPPYSKSWRASGSWFSASGSGKIVTVYCSQNTAGTYYGTVYCDVTDSTSHMKTFSQSVSATVNASYVAMTGSISPSSLSGWTTDQDFQWYTLGTGTINVSNGDAPYSQVWSITGVGLRINGSTTGTTAQVQVNRTTPGTYTGTLTCIVTDNTSATMTKTISVTGTVAPAYTPMTGSMADVSRSAFRPFGTQTIGVATAAISGGNPSKTYSFSLSNPGTSHFELTPAGNKCTIKQPHQSGYKTWTDTLTCVVTDGTGSKTVTCAVSFTATRT